MKEGEPISLLDIFVRHISSMEKSFAIAIVLKTVI